MPSSIIARAAKQAGIDEKETESRWEKAKELAIKAGFSKSDKEKFYAYVMGVFKKAMGFSEGEYQVMESALDDACAEVDTNPTPAQIASGNYKKGHCTMNGLNVTIENPKGSTRSGVSPDGKKWETTLMSHYGYVKGTEGRDGDHVDVFLGPTAETTDTVYIIDQLNKSKRFDEHKCMVGYDDEEDALASYLANYEKGWQGAGAVTPMSIEDFRAWIISDETKQPVSKDINRDGLVLESAIPATAILEDSNVNTEPIEPTAAIMPAPTIDAAIKNIESASTFDELSSAFASVFNDSVEAYKRADTEYGLQVRGKQARTKINQATVSILDRIKGPEDLTPEDISTLKQYSGIGGLGITDEGAQFEFYTPKHVAEGAWDGLVANGFKNGAVLEPSCGAGIFLATKPEGTIIAGVELNNTSATVAHLLNPTDVVVNQNFETYCVNTPDDSVDAVIGNVPFGAARGLNANDDPAYRSEKKIERYFLIRALDKVRPGGLCVLVTPPDIVSARNGKWSQWRIEVSKKAEFLGAHKMPSGTFKDNGTDTVVDLVVFKKHPKDLLDKIDRIPVETLQATNVLWDTFINGKWWQGEGKKYIMGKFIPKVDGDRFSRDRVDGDIDNAGMKAKLAQRFDSRIDWKTLDAVQVQETSVADGDHRIINGKNYVMESGVWVENISTLDQNNLDPAIYGAKTFDDLMRLFDSPITALALTYLQAAACLDAFGTRLPSWARDALKFAEMQTDANKERAWRGSLIGCEMGNLTQTLKRGQESGDPESLKAIIMAEIEKYGHPAKAKLEIGGSNSQAFGLFMGSVSEQDGKLADVLTGNYDTGIVKGYKPTDVASIVENLMRRPNGTELVVEEIEQLYEGDAKLSNDYISTLKGVAITPDGMITTMERATSGNVYQTIDALTVALGSASGNVADNYRSQIAMIKKRMNYTKLEDIGLTLQQSWIPKKYLIEFLKDTMHLDLTYGYVETRMQSDPMTGKDVPTPVFVADPEGTNPLSEFDFTTKKDGFLNQFLPYLNGKKMKNTTKIGEYNQQLEDITASFRSFMLSHTDAGEIEDNYNRKYNDFIAQEHSGESLNNPEVKGNIQLWDYQNAAVRRLSEDGRGILAFDVGLGKSYSALALYAHNTRMGRTKKTCIVIPKSVLSNWYHETREYLGDDLSNVLFVGIQAKIGKDGKPEMEDVLDENGKPSSGKTRVVLEDSNDADEIYAAMWQIPTSSKPLVIMTKEKFSSIPVRADQTLAYVQRMMDRGLITSKQGALIVSGNMGEEDLENNAQSDEEDDDVMESALSLSDAIIMEAAKPKKEKKEGAYALTTKAEKMKERLTNTGKKAGELPYYSDMGFDSVICDEGHAYKNSFTGGVALKNISYLSLPAESKIATDMSMKMELLRMATGGRGPYLLSATPITNSPVEIYNMLSLVMPFEEFQKRDISTPTSFIRLFGEVKPVDKMGVDGKVKNRPGLVGFQNLRELRSFFGQNCIMKTAQDVDLKIPEVEDIEHVSQMTDEQKNAYERLRIEATAAAGGNSAEAKLAMAKFLKMNEGKKPPVKKPRVLFAVMRDMERVTADMDLFYHTMTFHFRLEDAALVDKMIARLPPTVQFKVTEYDQNGKASTSIQPVELNYKKTIQDKTIVIVFPEGYEDSVVANSTLVGINLDEITHPIAPKYAALIDNCKKEFEDGGKQLIFTDEKTQHAKIARILANSLPILRGKIVLINADEANGDKLQQISNDYNAGRVKIAICNKKAEVGVNLQKGTTAIHHLTFPWTPASIQQRNGRGVRQGNTQTTVRVYSYSADGSFDSYRLNVLQKKAGWINSLILGDATTVENGNMQNQDDIDIMLAPESEREAMKQRKMQKIAEEKKKAEEKLKALQYEKLKRLHSTTARVLGLDNAKANERYKLQNEIAERTDELAKIPDDEKNKQRREAATIMIKGRQERLAKLDSSYESMRVKFQAQIDKDKFELNGAAASNSLAFDKSLIDNSDDVILGETIKDMVKVGNVYEMPNKNLCRVTEIDKDTNSFKLETIIDRFGYMNKNEQKKYMPPMLNGYASGGYTYDKEKMMLTSYSTDEIDEMLLLAKAVTFEKLMTIARDTFERNKYILKIKSNNAVIVKTGGGIELIDPRYSYTDEVYPQGGERGELVYPDPNDDDIKKAVCLAYLEGQRTGDFSNNKQILMATFLGENYRDVAATFGTRATEIQVLDMLNKKWRGVIDLEDLTEDKPKKMMDSLQYDYKQRFNDAVIVLGDNRAEINQWFSNWVISIIRPLNVLVQAQYNQASKANTVEVPDVSPTPETTESGASNTTIARIQALGMRYQTNAEPMYVRGIGNVKAGGAQGIQDPKGKTGKLYAAFARNEAVKSEYSARYYQGKVSYESFYGSWWVFPNFADMDKVVTLLESTNAGR